MLQLKHPSLSRKIMNVLLRSQGLFFLLAFRPSDVPPPMAGISGFRTTVEKHFWLCNCLNYTA